METADVLFFKLPLSHLDLAGSYARRHNQRVPADAALELIMRGSISSAIKKAARVRGI
jgi:hypothetical protein